MANKLVIKTKEEETLDLEKKNQELSGKLNALSITLSNQLSNKKSSEDANVPL